MAWYDEDSWLTAALSPNLSTILITFLVAIGLPILLHSFLYRKAAASTSLPTFLLVGPSGGGKTAFTTLTERNSLAQTHTSTQPLTIEALLPSPTSPPPRTSAPPATQPSSARGTSCSSTRLGTANCDTTQHLYSPTPTRCVESSSS
ncbi:signal recognition particle receptor subunit beta [Parastagonospora nodorum SN15]|uniref:Signal recognition particle receptor subunit beta n=1 Tax=Phaeosphaeria nodorum (strain SN15 / ATCC MYA-4574 / FGSC 10173) TaxID=321614 RepID=A0A7U2IBL7_PHANO|nr:signal recognition particle receptor subunit beta [Parastagonospora nodorum SN15]